MIIYNVTIQVDWKIHEEWLSWLQKEHVIQIMDTGLFQRYQLSRLINPEQEIGPTYCIQFFTTQELYNQYVDHYAIGLTGKGLDRWGTDFVSFSTIMEVVH